MRKIRCAGAIVTRPDGTILLVKRGNPPEAGRWSLPGGRVEPGESDQQALIREIHEETGLLIEPGPLVGSVERPAPDEAILDIHDYLATVTGGELAAGDDAADVAWVDRAHIEDRPLTNGLAQILREWGILTAGQPGAGLPGAGPPHRLIHEAMRRAGVIWLDIAGQPRARPAWYAWDGRAAFVVTGPGEQPLPGLTSGCQVAVTVPSKDTGAALVRWTSRAQRLEPGTGHWETAAGLLAAARLNAQPGSPVARWAASGAVFRLAAE